VGPTLAEEASSKDARMKKNIKSAITYGSGTINTWSGGKFSFIEPDPNDIRIADIAHALSLQCRFNGHVNEFYSVAEHSILVSDIVLKDTGDAYLALSGLLHDAAETYVGDVVSPLKRMLPKYLSYESLVEGCISEKFGVPYPHPPQVLSADKRALRQEFLKLAPFTDSAEPHKPMSPSDAESAFMKRYEELVQMCKDGTPGDD